MDVFWPSASPNQPETVNVTLHDLRQAFRALTDTAIVEFVDGAYLLNTLLDVWIDHIEAFDDGTSRPAANLKPPNSGSC